MNRILGSMKSSRVIAIVIVLLVVLGAVILIPLSSKEYSRNDRTTGGGYDGYKILKVKRYLFTTKVIMPDVMHGACDSVVIKAVLQQNVKVVTIATTSNSDVCSMQLVYSDAQLTFLWPIWEDNLIVKSGEKELFRIMPITD